MDFMFCDYSWDEDFSHSINLSGTAFNEVSVTGFDNEFVDEIRVEMKPSGKTIHVFFMEDDKVDFTWLCVVIEDDIKGSFTNYVNGGLNGMLGMTLHKYLSHTLVNTIVHKSILTVMIATPPTLTMINSWHKSQLTRIYG